MNANARWQEVISENLACSSIPGFKRQELSFEAVHAGMAAQPGLGTSASALVPRSSLFTNFAPGEMRATGVSTDVAIEGQGFFAVQLPDGQTGYTRDGEFQLNSTGELVTKQGFPVLGDTGTIQIDRNLSGALTISATGEVSQGEEVRGRLRIVDFDNPRLLRQSNGGTFVATHPDLMATDVASPSVRQGFLESANTSPATEMASLITAMRSFEAGQKLLHSQDERMARVISELGNPN